MSKRTAKPSHKAALTVAQKPEHQADGGRTHVSAAPTLTRLHPRQTWRRYHDAQWLTLLPKQANSSQVVTTFSGSRLGFPAHGLLLNHTQWPHQTSGSQRCSASQQAERQQLPRTHHPRPSLPVLAGRAPRAPVPGPARRSQSLELDRPQIPRDHLLQNPPSSNFTSKHTVASATVPGFTSGD